MYIISGKDWFTEKILGLQFKISPFSFFQTNTKGAEGALYKSKGLYTWKQHRTKRHPEEIDTAAVNKVNNIKNSEKSNITDVKNDSDAAEVFREKVVFDLYSGTGTIAQIIAPVAKKVIGVEIVEEAVEAAKENAAINGLDNCEFIAGDVLKVIDEIEEKPDYIILDPPREGIHPKAIRKIIDYGVKNIVYISCKPTSLSQDLATFETFGYHVERVSNVDMFPGTVHVESVVLMQYCGK